MFVIALKALWFLLPAAAANAAPLFAAKLFPRWDTPLDFGKSFRGRRILGSHKTVRGLASGIAAGVLAAWIQSLISGGEQSPFWLMGAVMGFGALAGDAIKSFFKRQARIAPGSAWFPWDQVDWVWGTLAATRPFVSFDASFFLAATILGIAIHLAGHAAGYALGLTEKAI